MKSENLWIIGIVGSVMLLIAALMWGHQIYNSNSLKQDHERIVKGLPEGCTFHELGNYGNIRNTFFIRCENKITTTEGTISRPKSLPPKGFTVISE